MDTILTLDIGSTSMRASLHDPTGKVLHRISRQTTPQYLAEGRVELDGREFVNILLSLLKESSGNWSVHGGPPVSISVTSQRSSVVPVNNEAEPLAPFIMWHDKRTVPICQELQPQEARVYQMTGLRISPVLSAVKMTWLRRNCQDIYKKTVKMLGIHDLALHTLCGKFVTDHSLASNTNLLNIRTRKWDPELLDIFSVDPSHLCDLTQPGAICGYTNSRLKLATGISEGIPVISAGGDQQCAALGLGIIFEGRLKCTTGTGSYVIAHVNNPVIDTKQRFLCKIGAIPGSYNLEAGLLTTGTVYRWFLEQFYEYDSSTAGIEAINNEVISSPPGANGVLLLPHFEGSGAPHWNPADNGVFYRLKLSTTRADMARAVLEGIVMDMGENIALFKEILGDVSQICVAGGMSQFLPYNQLQADIYGAKVSLYPNRESTSLGAWISAAVSCGLYSTYEEACAVAQPPGSETVFSPDPELTSFYGNLTKQRVSLYKALRSIYT
jgi:sugar (pentulose or hexulose) kinase